VLALVRAGRAAAEDDRLGELLVAPEALADVAELRVVRGHVAEDALRLVELAAALEVERQAVHVLHHLLVQRRLAELVERHVELALLLEREAQHAVRFRALRVGLLLAALGDEVVLGGEQRVADHEERGGQHELHPQARADHHAQVRCEDRGEQRRGDDRALAGRKPRQQQRDVERHQQVRAQRRERAPRRRDEEMLGEDRRDGVRQRLHRRHAGGDRRHLARADAGRGRADEHDLVGVLRRGILPEYTSKNESVVNAGWPGARSL
jgi:hypothetical protein